MAVTSQRIAPSRLTTWLKGLAVIGAIISILALLEGLLAVIFIPALKSPCFLDVEGYCTRYPESRPPAPDTSWVWIFPIAAIVGIVGSGFLTRRTLLGGIILLAGAVSYLVTAIFGGMFKVDGVSFVLFSPALVMLLVGVAAIITALRISPQLDV